LSSVMLAQARQDTLDAGRFRRLAATDIEVVNQRGDA
jgi:hypothetical protein